MIQIHELAKVMDIENTLRRLSKERPVFHSEADFQHALAWEIHRNDPSADLRLEINLPEIGNRAMADIFVRKDQGVYALELKYKTKLLNLSVRGENFRLLNHGAQDIGRYDFVKDIWRLERFVNAIGYAIFLTNDDNYWKQTKRPTTADEMFRLHDQCRLQGSLQWGATTGKGIMKGRERALDLKNLYPMKWGRYSDLPCEGPRIFKYILLCVTPSAIQGSAYERASSEEHNLTEK